MDGRSNLTHPLPVPDLRDRLVADVAEYLLPGPVVRAQKDATVVENIGRREGRRAMTEPRACDATTNAMSQRYLLARKAKRGVELGSAPTRLFAV